MIRRPPGNIGAISPRLLLVDPAGTYHLGGGSRIQYRGSFLLLNDVAVFTGNRLIPVFEPDQLREHISPLARSGVRVDRKTLAVKLLESRHPVALAFLAMIVSAGAALAVLIALS